MYTLQRSNKDGVAIYHAIDRRGKVKATLAIKDGKYKNFSLVPSIVKLQGSSQGVLFLLDWATTKSKGPIVSPLKYWILFEYGFRLYSDGLVWDPFETKTESINEPLRLQNI